MSLSDSSIEITKAILLDLTNLRPLKACKTTAQCDYWQAILHKEGATVDMRVMGFARRYWSALSFRELMQVLFNMGKGSGRYSSTDMAPAIYEVVYYTQQMPVDDTPIEELEARLGTKLRTYQVREMEGSATVHRSNSMNHVDRPSTRNNQAEAPDDGATLSVPAVDVPTTSGDATMAAAKKAAAKAAPKKTAAPKAAKEPKTAKPKAEKVEQNGIVRPRGMTSKCGRVWAIADEVSKKKRSPASFQEIWEIGEKEGLNQSNVRVEYAKWRKFNGVEGRVAPKEKKAPAAAK